jgi:hypothetical protein
MTIEAPGFLIVDQQVARNPVARAIQRQRIERSTRDFRIRVHMLADGEAVQADALASAKVLAVALGVLQMQGAEGCTAWRLMRGGISALQQLSERGFRWRPIDAVPVDVALEHAAATIVTAPAALVQRAWIESEQAPALQP